MEHAAHSLHSASNWDADVACPGRAVLNARVEGVDRAFLKDWSGLDIPPDSSNIHADTGTVVHYLLKVELSGHSNLPSFVGTLYKAGTNLGGDVLEFDVLVTDEMVGNALDCANYARALAGDKGTLFSESRVCYAGSLGVPQYDAWGTADIIVYDGDGTLYVIDYKNGYKPVYADTAQIKLYALGALDDFAAKQRWQVDTVSLQIYQPNVRSEPDVVIMTVEDLREWAIFTATDQVKLVRRAIDEIHPAHAPIPPVFDSWAEAHLVAGETQCRYCLAAGAGCPKARELLADTLRSAPLMSLDEFDNQDAVADDIENPEPDVLARCLDHVDYIEELCKAWREEALRRLEAGQAVGTYKLVRGKAGNRSWADADEAEATLKSMRLKQDQMYNFKLITPPQAEKLVKSGALTERRWKKLQDIIVQPPGGLHVAPATDKRPAVEVKPVIEQFDDLSELA